MNPMFLSSTAMSLAVEQCQGVSFLVGFARRLRWRFRLAAVETTGWGNVWVWVKIIQNQRHPKQMQGTPNRIHRQVPRRLNKLDVDTQNRQPCWSYLFQTSSFNIHVVNFHAVIYYTVFFLCNPFLLHQIRFVIVKTSYSEWSSFWREIPSLILLRAVGRTNSCWFRMDLVELQWYPPDMSAVGRIQAELLSLGVGITFTLHVFALEGQTVPNVVTLTMANGAHSDAAASPLGRPRWGQQEREEADDFWYMGMWMFPKDRGPQIIHFNRVFHYKPSILGYPYFWKHPCWCVLWWLDWVDEIDRCISRF